jgi:hypothetical protein
MWIRCGWMVGWLNNFCDTVILSFDWPIYHMNHVGHVGHGFNVNDWNVMIDHDLKMRIRNTSGGIAKQKGIG